MVTFRIMGPIVTLSITKVSIMGLITTLSIIISIATLSLTKVSTKGLIATLSIRIFSIMTQSILGLVAKLSNVTLAMTMFIIL
jgi:hypothetical protein